MKKEKGFTLIELLAVIVILAIILLISTPIILNIIEDVRKGAFKSSVHGYLKSAEYKHLEGMLDGSSQEKIFIYVDGELQGDEDLDYGGESPKNGTIHITKDGKIALAIHNGKWCAMKNYDNSEITVTDKTIENCKLDNLPEIVNEFNEEKGVNKPVLASGMTPIIYNETTGEWDEVNENDSNWYNYDAKKWANVRTNDGSMWVWIPRYAYKITNGYHSSEAGEIEVKFLKGKTNKTVDGTIIETSGYEIGVKDTSMHYFLHPAFQFDGEELGFWMAKFEPTAAEGVTTITGACNTLDNVDSKTVKIIPNATSWRCINNKNIFNVSFNMKNKTDTYGWLSTEVDTHLIKNTEWGAVSYLSKSKYGVHNEKIWNNAYNQYKTGCSGNIVDAASESTCIEYHTEKGVKASTTHNIYGVYDMSGGAWERVMGNYNNLGGSNSGFTNAEVEAIDDKYIDRYNTSTENLLNGVGMDFDKLVYSDGIYETSYNAYRNNGSLWEGNPVGSWNGDFSYMPYGSSYTWFNRGGAFDHGSKAGVFGFSHTNANADWHHSFRPVAFIK